MSDKRKFLFCTDDIGLRCLSEEELEGPYISWFSDEKVCHFNSHLARPVSKQSCKSYIENLDTNYNRVWAVYHLKDNIHIGNLSIQNINWINRNGEIAFIFGETRYWGKGYAYQAAQIILKYCYSILNLKRVYCGTSANNHAMQALAKKLGMKEEGRRRKALFEHGQYVDIVEYGLLEDEFDPR